MRLDSDSSPNFPILLTVIFVLIVVGGTVDLVLDAPESLLSVHVLFEVTLIVTSLGIVVYLTTGWYRSIRSLATTREALSTRQLERDAWKDQAQKALEGLASAIDRQFDKWQLTPTERETALALLKGTSHKAFAINTGRSVRTVRQHAVSVYRKSGQQGRAELAGFFFEGLVVPGTGRMVRASSPSGEGNCGASRPVSPQSAPGAPRQDSP